MELLEHITAEDIAKYGVVAAPDKLEGDPRANKMVFDRLVREMVAGAFNSAVDVINATMIAAEGWGKEEAERVEAELARIAEENLRAAAETARAAEETARSAAETIRETNERNRQSRETAREQAEENRADAESNREAKEKTRQSQESARATAETSRATAESNRETKEQARQSQESTRQTNEQTRQGQESTRQTQETTRQANEQTRKTAEQSRASGESARGANEKARAAAEDLRVSAETSRTTAENLRASAETSRINAENLRKSAETDRINAENLRVDAEEARVAAEKIRDEAYQSRKVVQETGNSTTAVMSQAAVTKELRKLSNEIADYLPKNQGAENVGKILAVGTDGNLVLVPMPEGGADGDVIGTLDESNNILLTGNLADGTYTIKYEMDDGSVVNIGSLVVSGIVYVSVTNNLTNCTNSNSATQAVKGESYSATITADSGYELPTVEVTMGGNPVTVSDGVISIAEVTGDIVITAVAEEVNIETNFAEYNATNTSDWSIWINNARAGSDGAYRSDTFNESYGTPAVSNYVAVQNGDVIEFTGLYSANKNSVLYDSTKKPLSSNGIGILTNLTANLSNVSLDVANYAGTFTISNTSIAYVRIGGYVGYRDTTASDISIKIKRNGVYL